MTPPNAGMSAITGTVAGFAAHTAFDDLPPALVLDTRLVLLDLIGCALAGATVPKGGIAVRLAQRLGGAGETSILGAGGKVSGPHAAFANGELMNALDWDPIPHTLPCVAAACLAAAESTNASGRDLILAMAIGTELAERLAQLLPGDLEPEPHGYGSCSLGCAAGAGRLLGLPEERLAHALGIAGFAAPMPAMNRFEGGMSPIPMTKYGSLGWIAQTAITAALLAEQGYTGDTAILDGPDGFWRLFGGTEERWDPERFTSGLGSEWRARKPWYKPYPCEVLIGVALNRLRDIMAENALTADDIRRVDFRSLPVLATPCHTTTTLVSHVDAQFSVPYAMAVTALGIEPGPAWQQPSTMRDPGVARFMDKVTVGIHTSELESPGEAKKASSVGQIPCHLVVHAKGRAFSIERTESFLTEAQIVTKFKRNAAWSLPDNRIEEAAEMILDLESVDDVAGMMEILTPRVAPHLFEQ